MQKSKSNIQESKGTAQKLKTAEKRAVKLFAKAKFDDTVGEAKKAYLKIAGQLESRHYVYVVNGKNKLVGILSIKDLFNLPQNKKLSEVMVKEIVSVRTNTHQERVAILSLKHRLNAIPIVNKENEIVGIVPEDEILKIMHEENTEDFLKFAGIKKFNYHDIISETISPMVSMISRAPWLIIGLIGGLFAAGIVEFFEGALKEEFILASFIPLIVYIADAVGTQTETVFVRFAALNLKFNFKKYLLKEIITGMFIGVLLGLLLFLFSIFFLNQPKIGIILFVALFLTSTIAAIIGFLIPFVLILLKCDPAIGAGPFATIFTDIISLVVYFSSVSLLYPIL